MVITRPSPVSPSSVSRKVSTQSVVRSAPMIELWIGGSIGRCTTWVRRRVIFIMGLSEEMTRSMPTCQCEAQSAEAIPCLTRGGTLVRREIASAQCASQ